MNALDKARKPGKMMCPVCNEALYAPMDKLCIILFGYCIAHMEPNSAEERRLLKMGDRL